MDDLTPAQSEATAEILRAGRHLLGLIDEVLDISRIEAGRLRLSLEPVDAVQAAEECISLLRPQAEREGVSLALEQGGVAERSAYVIADRQRLKQVLLNLISNGIKYNREHGSVRISFHGHEEDRRLRIGVTDTGHGIPAERMEHLFAPFERLGAEESGVEGTGLGLALSHSLVEAMGGTLSVATRTGKGSTFSVELASAKEDSPSAEGGTLPAEHAVLPSDSRPWTILHIEDNLSNHKLVERLVARRQDIVLMSAMQGSVGVALARAHRPDLILLDLNLPDIPGEEVLARLRSDPRTVDLPVVVVSADVTNGQKKRLLDAGAREFIPKPIDVKRLLQVVDAACAKGSLGAGRPS